MSKLAWKWTQLKLTLAFDNADTEIDIMASHQLIWLAGATQIFQFFAGSAPNSMKNFRKAWLVQSYNVQQFKYSVLVF